MEKNNFKNEEAIVELSLNKTIKNISNEIKDKINEKNMDFVLLEKKFVDLFFYARKIIEINLSDCGLLDIMITFLIDCDFNNLSYLNISSNLSLTEKALVAINLLTLSDKFKRLNISNLLFGESEINLIPKLSVFNFLEEINFNQANLKPSISLFQFKNSSLKYFTTSKSVSITNIPQAVKVIVK